MVAKVYNTPVLNRIRSEVEKILKKNQNRFCKDLSTTFQILTIHRLIEVHAKNIETRHLTLFTEEIWSKYF